MEWVLGSRGQYSCRILILRHAHRVISPLLRSFSGFAVEDRLYLGRTLLRCVSPTCIICVLRQVHDCESCHASVIHSTVRRSYEARSRDTYKGSPYVSVFMDELSERTRSPLFKMNDPNNGTNPIQQISIQSKIADAYNMNNGFIFFQEIYIYVGYTRDTQLC